jgi:hypothetical protein
MADWVAKAGNGGKGRPQGQNVRRQPSHPVMPAQAGIHNFLAYTTVRRSIHENSQNVGCNAFWHCAGNARRYAYDFANR